MKKERDGVRLLVISERYEDRTNANAHCVHLLLDAMVRQGAMIDLITVAHPSQAHHQPSNPTVYAIPPIPEKQYIPHRNRMLYLLDKAAVRAVDLFAQKNTAERALLRQARALCKQHAYDGFLAVHRTHLSVKCGLQLMPMLRHAHTMLYLLDPIGSAIDQQSAGDKYRYWVMKYRERRAYQRFDTIIQMSFNREDIKTPQYRPYESKTVYLGVPLLRPTVDTPQTVAPAPEHRPDGFRLVCFGILDSLYRSPDYLLRLLVEMNRHARVHISFYTKGDCEEALAAFAKKHPTMASCYGYVSPEALRQIINASDGVVCIENAISHMVPSKVFDVFSLGKPAISLSKQAKDPTDAFFLQYENATIVKETTGIVEAASKTMLFLQESRGRVVSNKVLLDRFEEYTPDYSARAILQLTKRAAAANDYKENEG